MCIRDRYTEDNAKHTVCNRWATRRTSLIWDIGTIAPDNMVGTMLREEDVCNHTAHYSGILRTAIKSESTGRSKMA